jgi:hypothetical protein
VALVCVCVCECISAVVEGDCVRDCRGLELCTVGTVGLSEGGECVVGKGSMARDWGRIGGGGEAGGKSG